MAVVVSRMFVLCDTANIRDGLLNVLGAGLSELGRESYPSTLGCTVAMMLEISEFRQEESFNVRVAVTRPDGTAVDVKPFEMTLTDSPGDGDDGDSSYTVPMFLDATDLPIPEEGPYKMTLSVNGLELSTLRFLSPLRRPLRELAGQRTSLTPAEEK